MRKIMSKIVSVEALRRDGFFDGWSKSDVRAFVDHQNELRRRRKKLAGGDFNPFTDDPNCKSCRKKKRIQ